jgi:hypothetical protein
MSIDSDDEGATESDVVFDAVRVGGTVGADVAGS